MAAKMLLKHILSTEIANLHQYEDIRTSIQGQDKQIRATEEAFGLEATTQLHHLADTLAGSEGTIILYDEMATLAGCDDLAADLQALALITRTVNPIRSA